MGHRNLSVMFTDMKGFSPRTSSQSRAATTDMIHKHRDLILPGIVKRGGKLIKSIGDAFLVTFESPTDAVIAGMELQDTLRKYNSRLPEKEQIQIRVAINTGEVIVEDNDVYGEAVNIAARIEGIAEPNEIYFTESTYLSMNKSEVPSAEIGYRILKGIPEKIKIYKVLQEKRRSRDSSVVTMEVGQISWPLAPPARRVSAFAIDIIVVCIITLLLLGGRFIERLRLGREIRERREGTFMGGPGPDGRHEDAGPEDSREGGDARDEFEALEKRYNEAQKELDEKLKESEDLEKQLRVEEDKLMAERRDLEDKRRKLDRKRVALERRRREIDRADGEGENPKNTDAARKEFEKEEDDFLNEEEALSTVDMELQDRERALMNKHREFERHDGDARELEDRLRHLENDYTRMREEYRIRLPDESPLDGDSDVWLPRLEEDYQNMGHELKGKFFILYMLLFPLYSTVMLGLRGKTFGKMLTGLRVYHVGGYPLTWGRSLARSVLYYVSGSLLGIGFVWAFFDDKYQALHDKIAQTCVVFEKLR